MIHPHTSTHLPPSAAYIRQWTGLSLVQIMACRLLGAKPLHEPLLVYCQLDSWEQISVKFKSEFYHFHSWKSIWKCRLPKWWPFCPAGDEFIHVICSITIRYDKFTTLQKQWWLSSTMTWHDDVIKWKHFRVTGHLCGEFTGLRWIPTQRPVTRNFDVFFDLRLNERLSKHSWGWWLETPSRHYDATIMHSLA